jgi:hypothetical protein
MHISHTRTKSITIMIIRHRWIDRHKDRESESTKKQKWFTSWRRSRKLLGAFLIEATRSRALACLVLRLDPFACFFGWGPVYHKHQSKVQNTWTWEPTNDQLWQIVMQSWWKAKLNHMVDAFVMHFVSVVVPWSVWEGTHFAHRHHRSIGSWAPALSFSNASSRANAACTTLLHLQLSLSMYPTLHKHVTAPPIWRQIYAMKSLAHFQHLVQQHSRRKVFRKYPRVHVFRRVAQDIIIISMKKQYTVVWQTGETKSLEILNI